MDNFQRKFKRIPSTIMAKCRLLDGLERYHTVSLLNFHHAGCCLGGDVSFEAGQKLMVVLELPLEGLLYLHAEVRWVKPFRGYKKGLLVKGHNIGVCFLQDDPVTKDACDQIYKYCEVRQTRDYQG